MMCLVCNQRPMRARGRCDACYSKARRVGAITVRQRGTPRRCAVAGCDRMARSMGWCRKHYQYNYVYGTPTPPERPRICVVEGCDRTVLARGLCRKHYQHNYMFGTPLTRKEARR